MAERAAVGEWGGLVDSADRPVWVSSIDDVVVGYLELEIDGDTARVMQVYVDPMAREIGFGDWLLEAAIDEVPIFVDVPYAFHTATAAFHCVI